MALALSSTIGFVNIEYPNAVGTVSTGSVSLPANSLIVIVAGHDGVGTDYGYPGTLTNTGTALTWTYASGALNDDGSYYNSLQIWYAKNTSAQTVNISSTFTSGADFPVLSAMAGYVFTGHNTTTPIGAVGGGNTGTITTTAAGSYVVSGIIDFGSATYTSSNMTYQVATIGAYASAFAAYASRPTAGSFTASYASGSFTVPAYEIIEILAAGGGTAHTAAGTATGTATGTAAMRNARVGAGASTETATGTAAASNQRALAGTSSVTASATAAMSSTQVIGASGTGTASGSAAGAITAVVTISGAGTGTASATAGASSTQLLAGSATVTATGTADSSIRPLVTVDGVGTITATGATTASKQQTLAATASATASATAGLISITPISASATVTATATALALITTPGTLYGNAEKVAGLYGSSTKPTLTTRS